MEISEIASHCGGVIAMSLKLGLSRAAMAGWKQVPAERVIQVCEKTGWKVTPHDVRPDLYPNRCDAMPKRAKC